MNENYRDTNVEKTSFTILEILRVDVYFYGKESSCVLLKGKVRIIMFCSKAENTVHHLDDQCFSFFFFFAFLYVCVFLLFILSFLFSFNKTK